MPVVASVSASRLPAREFNAHRGFVQALLALPVTEIGHAILLDATLRR